LRVAGFIGHFRRRRQRRKIQPAQPRDRPEPIRVKRIMLIALDETVAVAVLGDEPLRGQLDLRPGAFQKCSRRARKIDPACASTAGKSLNSPRK
jgi:hypothetical protein